LQKACGPSRKGRLGGNLA